MVVPLILRRQHFDSLRFPGPVAFPDLTDCLGAVTRLKVVQVGGLQRFLRASVNHRVEPGKQEFARVGRCHLKRRTLHLV